MASACIFSIKWVMFDRLKNYLNSCKIDSHCIAVDLLQVFCDVIKICLVACMPKE